MSLGLLMSGEGKFLPPKLSLLLQLAASASLSSPLPHYALHMVFSCIIYGKSSVSVQADLRWLGQLYDRLTIN
jgi:hypothetical protein